MMIITKIIIIKLPIITTIIIIVIEIMKSTITTTEAIKVKKKKIKHHNYLPINTLSLRTYFNCYKKKIFHFLWQLIFTLF